MIGVHPITIMATVERWERNSSKEEKLVMKMCSPSKITKLLGKVIGTCDSDFARNLYEIEVTQVRDEYLLNPALANIC